MCKRNRVGTPNFSAIHPRHNHIYIAACDTFARYRGRTPPRFPHTSRRCSRAYANHRMTILPLTSPILQPVPLPLPPIPWRPPLEDDEGARSHTWASTHFHTTPSSSDPKDRTFCQAIARTTRVWRLGAKLSFS